MRHTSILLLCGIVLLVLIAAGDAEGAFKKMEGGRTAFEMTIQQGHSDWVNAVAFFPDGSFFASASKDATVKIWSMDGKILKTLPHDYLVLAVAVSRDGKYLASAGPEEVRVWSIHKGDLIATFRTKSYAQAVGFSADGKKVISGWSDGFLRAYDLERRSLSWEIRAHTSGVRALAVSPGGVLIATGSFCREARDKRDTVLRLWYAESGKPAGGLEGHRGDIADAAFSGDGQMLASCGDLGEIMLWSVKGRSLIKTFPGSPRNVNMKRLALSNDGRYLAATGMESENVRIWRIPDASPVASFSAQRAGNNDLRFSPDSRFLLTASDDHSLRLWDIRTLKCERVYPGSSGRVTSVDITSDGTRVVAGVQGVKSSVKVWNLTDGSMQATCRGYNTVAFSPEGRHYATAVDSSVGFSFDNNYENSVEIFTLDGERIKELAGPRNDVNALCYSPDGRYLAAAGNKEIRVWDVATGRTAYHFKELGRNVEDVRFTPDGRNVVVIGENGLSIRSIADGTAREGYHCRDEIRSIAVSRTHLAAAVFKDVLLWKRGSEAPRTLKGHTAAVLSVAMSPDGRYLASGGYDRRILLWRISDGTVMREYRGHQDWIRAVRFTPDGRHIISGSHDSSVRVWNVKDGSSMALVSSGDSEWIMYNDDGYFDGSRYGGQAVLMAAGLDSWGVDQFAVGNNRPDIILQRMGLGAKPLIDTFYSRYLSRLKKSGYSNEEALSDRPHAPDAKLTSMAIKGKYCTVGLALSDSLYDIKSYSVFVNDVPLYGAYGKPAKGKKISLVETVELTEGKNKIEVSCVNAKGAESFRALTYAEYKAPVKGDLYFLGFGVSRYRDASLDLKYADKDARDLAEMCAGMKDAYNNVHVKTYLNEEVTTENIRRAKDFLRNAKADDTFVLFIAGHGIHDTDREATYYYLTHAADRNNLAGTCAHFEMIEDMLQGIAPRSKLFLMDTCESGEIDDDVQSRYHAAAGSRGIKARAARGLAITGKAAPVKRPFLLKRDRYIFNDLIRRSGAIVFSSSRGGEFSYESDSIRNGYFTKELIAAIKDRAADKNRDGLVSTDELREYVPQAVAKGTGDLQHPTVDRDNLYQKFAFPAK